MVKNNKGGNKAKKQGRKFAQPDPANVQTRYSSDPDEVYACCTKLLGNGMCYVICIDGIERLCIIRRKFSGRGKRGNTLVMGTWCLIGRRGFETKSDTKREKCDLLEVYGDIDKKKIMQKEVQYKDNWKLFTTNLVEIDDSISFGEGPNLQLPPSDESDESDSEIGNEIDNNLGEEIDVDDI
jgi:hypothetical protein